MAEAWQRRFFALFPTRHFLKHYLVSGAAMSDGQRTALVTGAAKRVGRAIVEGLVDAGYAVAIHCNRSRDDGVALAAEIEKRGGRAMVVLGDLAQSSVPQSLIAECVAAIGPLSLLVNNASLFESDTALDLDAEQWARHFDINLRAPCFLASAFAKHVADHADRITDPSIVNVIDHRVWKLTPQFFSYTLSKAALLAATQTLAQSLAPLIRVNGVGPGPTLPNHHDGQAGLEREAAGVLLRRPSPPQDIAEAVLYLARARSVTGQMIAVDAGQHLGWQTPDIILP
jgi:NAD(P)-dependent dehydrogenase (short-subunit alcohol dehydrogenase family)